MPFLLSLTSWFPPLILATEVAKSSPCTLTPSVLPALASRSHSMSLSQGFFDAVTWDVGTQMAYTYVQPKSAGKAMSPTGNCQLMGQDVMNKCFFPLILCFWEAVYIFLKSLFQQDWTPAVFSGVQVFFFRFSSLLSLRDHHPNKLSTCKSLPQILLYRYSK